MDDDLDPDTAAERAVLGDELQLRGDPQGELVQLQLALAALPADAPAVKRRAIDRRVLAVLGRAHDAFYGELAAHVTSPARPDVHAPVLEVTRWRAGFADEIWLQTTIGDTPDLAAAYRGMRALPIARLVRALRLGHGDYGSAFAAIAADPPPQLRSLVVGDRRLPLPRLRLALSDDWSGLGPVVGQLETLELLYARPHVPFRSATLRRLHISAPYDDPAPVRFTGELPALAELTCWYYRIDDGLFERFPALARVNLGVRGLDPDWLERFLLSPHVGRVTHLSLGWFPDDRIGEVVLRHADRVARLVQLDLSSGNQMSAAIADRIRAELPNVRLE